MSLACSAKEALRNPLTEVPLSVGCTDGSLRQSSSKISKLRNFLIEAVDGCVHLQGPFEARWIFDGFNVWHRYPPMDTYKE